MTDLKTRRSFIAPTERAPGGPAGSSLKALVVLAAALLLAVVVLVVYGQGLRGQFLGADHALFNRSPLVSPPASPGGPATSLPSWLPRATEALSLAANRAVWGPLPAGFRTMSVVWHWLTSVLIFLLALRWMRTPGAAAAALLFAVHPLHVAAVDVAGERGEILATFFGLLALLFLSVARGGGPDVSGEDETRGKTSSKNSEIVAAASTGSRAGWLAASFAACLAAAFSSPIALTLPLIVLLADLLGAEDRSPEQYRRRTRDWLVLAAACLPAAIAAAVVAPPSAPMNRWLAGRAFLESLSLLFVPYPLRVYRIIGPQAGLDALSLLALPTALVLLVGLLLLARRRGLPFPAIALLLSVIPVLALVLVPPRGPGSDVPFPILEGRLYWPSAGACLVLAGLIEGAFFRAGARSRKVGVVGSAGVVGTAAVAAAIALVFAGLAVVRHRVFRSDAELYTAAAMESPTSPVVRVRLAEVVGMRGQPDKAIEVLQPLIAQRPSDPELHLLLANLHRDANDLASAEAEANEAFRLRPSFARAQGTLGLIEREKGNIEGAEKAYREAIALDPNLAEAHNNLGALLTLRDEPLEALEEMKKALELDPTLGDAAANLASFLMDQKRTDEALEVLGRGLEYSEANPRLHHGLGVVLQSQGRRREAAKAYQRAIQLDPSYARPMNNLAILLTEEKKYDDAIALLRRLTELEPSNERAHYNLGIAYRSQGDTKSAAAAFAAALKLRPDYTDASRALSEMLNAPRANTARP